MEGGARLRRECSAEKKATSFLRFLTRIFLADGFYRSIEAGEKPVAHQSSIGGRRRACPTILRSPAFAQATTWQADL